MSHRPAPTHRTSPRLARVRDEVRATFARVLARDPEVSVSPDGDELKIQLRDKVYGLNVVVTAVAACVYVRRIPGDNPGDMFFNFDCPVSRMGPLRRVALTLLKKMQHAEVYEVINA